MSLPNCFVCEDLGWYWDPDGLTDQKYDCDCDAPDSRYPSIAELNWSPELVHDMVTEDGHTCYDERCFQHRGLDNIVQLVKNVAVAGMLEKAYQKGLDDGELRWCHLGAQ